MHAGDPADIVLLAMVDGVADQPPARLFRDLAFQRDHSVLRMLDAGVHALGVLPHDDGVQVAYPQVGRQTGDRSHVRIEVEVFTQTEDGGTVVLDARVGRGDGPEKTGVGAVERQTVSSGR